MKGKPTLEVIFFRSNTGREHVRDWLKSLGKKSTKVIGEEVKTVQFGWPNKFAPPHLVGNIVGVAGLSEVRSSLRKGRQQARILFTVKGKKMILLHGFFKQRPKINEEIKIAEERLKLWEGEYIE